MYVYWLLLMTNPVCVFIVILRHNSNPPLIAMSTSLARCRLLIYRIIYHTHLLNVTYHATFVKHLPNCQPV